MEHSVQFELLKKRFLVEKSISASMLVKYVKVGRITEEEYNEITGLVYPTTK